MNKKLLSEYIKSILNEASKAGSPANIQRMAIGHAIASRGNFDFSPTTSNPSPGKGIRLNPTELNKNKGSDEIEALLKTDASYIGIAVNQAIGPGSSKEEGSLSGKYISFPLQDSWAWLKTPSGKVWIVDSLIKTGKAKDQKDAEEIVANWTDNNYLKTNDIIVINATSLASRLWTGQGIGELAEYAVAAAVKGDPDEQFTKAVTGAILRPSWKKANNGSSESVPTTDEANKFRAHFDAMAGITKKNMEIAARKKVPSQEIKELFGFEASVQGGGGGLVDVVTNVADIHVKFNEPSRLSGNQQKGASRKNAVTDNDSLMIKVEQLERGRADAYWKQMREWFKQHAGITTDRDKEPLMNHGFYEWLLDGIINTKLQEKLDNIPELKAWVDTQTPNISQYLIPDFIKAMTSDRYVQGDPGRANALSSVFYFTFYPDRGGKYRLKIEELNSQLGLPKAELAGNLNVIMNPNYKGLPKPSGSGSVGHPYVITDATTGEVYAKLEFRSTASSKPIQFHRGKSFGSSDKDDNKFISKTLIELRRIINRILSEETSKDNTTVI